LVVEIDGGKVALNTTNVGNKMGALSIQGDLNFNGGEYDAKVDGQVRGSNDNITASGAIRITNGIGKLVVSNINNGIGVGLSWDILVAGGGLTIDFGTKNLAPGLIGPDPGQVNNGIYRIKTLN
jgi:hypothetical protein